MRRLAVDEENGPPASALDSPNNGELKLPIGFATFTLLNIFLAFTLNVRL